MTTIFAIDPGPKESGIAWYNKETKEPYGFKVVSNDDVLDILYNETFDVVAIEMMQSYGMTVGAKVFQTCVWIGRFVEAAASLVEADLGFVYKPEVLVHLCGTRRAKDPNVKQVIRDRFDCPKLTPPKGHVLHGISKHAWDALAVAITWAEGGIGERQVEGLPF